MNSVVKLVTNDVDAIPFQEASLDIWEKKYRLVSKSGEAVDKTMDDTYKRVARALADVEPESQREHWHERFLWALRRGAIPAGRITSNAGALQHKPATSTINCTVSGIIPDSMKGILEKNPFQTIDRGGVGKLMDWAISEGRKSRPSLEVGICGEHGGDADSVKFFHRLGMNYVSCSPFRVPIARLAAAQAALETK